MRVPSSRGTSIVVHDLGGEGPALLVCHATGFCGGAYRPLAAALAPHHRVFALDARGHGESTPPDDGDFDWGGMADDVAAAARAVAGVADGPLHVVGHSMGGAAALLAEQRAPGTFASAYLYEPIVPTAPLPAGAGGDAGPGDAADGSAALSNPMADAARRRREVFASRAEALWRYASRPPLAVLQAASLAAYVEAGFADLPDGSVRLRCRAEHEARTFASTGGIHLAVVADVAVPTVVACGGADPGMVADMGPNLAAALPHATLERHPRLGHFGPLQDPATIAAAIVAHTTATTATPPARRRG
ncbi:alpha/beta hydrolase [Iamia sp. SCSIO 61187]|uniref:alpha/beta fold hydrolase n=1 Tax=Iamia sp. SCSIO 61187 TaxID=2722752 RepID=UPI001C62E76F|nr:alpha/beta hydrolase [Iamia sp. SCSIO 61187]QYG94864.1 alpha/beta hydrolase [Iamia sp. SCSIO 61187]